MTLAMLMGRQHVSDDEIMQTDEYKALIKGASEGVALKACKMVLRESFGSAKGAVKPIETQLTVFGALDQLVRREVTMTWVPSGPGGNNAFVKFITDRAAGFNFAAGTTVNCWEVILLAGMLDARILQPDRLREYYDQSPDTFEKNLTHALMGGRRIAYDPARTTGRPLQGDIVMFGGLDHVAVATGQMIQGPMISAETATGARIVSFWPAPSQKNFGARTKTQVDVTTIEAILLWHTENEPGTPLPQVQFGTPDWSLLT